MLLVLSEYREMFLVLISVRRSGRRPNEMKQKNYTTSQMFIIFT